MDSVGRNATARYVATTIFITTSAVGLMLDIVHVRPGPPSLNQKALGILLVLLAIYTQISLRARHVYYRKMAVNGCKPIPTYPNNVLGIPFLLESAKGLQENNFLQLRREQLGKLGRTFQHRMFPEMLDSIVTDDPQNIKTILSTRFDDWILPRHRIKGFLPVLGYHSIFMTNGPEWQHSRAMLRPAFVRDQIADLECFDKHISKLIEKIPKDGSRFDLQAMFALLTIDSISDFMFGQTTNVLGNPQERDIKLGKYFDLSLVKIAKRARLGWVTMLLPDRELDEYTRFLRSYVDDLVAERKQANAKETQTQEKQKYVFLDELLKTGEPDEVIRNQLLSIFLAGRDTTTSVLAYLFYELSRRPDVVAKIQKEIRELGMKDPSWEELKNMKYLNWTVKESLRLNPPVPNNAREAVRDTILPSGGGPDGKSPTFVPKNTSVRYQTWVMHRRKDLYGEDADEFLPERWENLKVGFEYVPFNAGPRICIGQNFALTQMAMVTFRLLQAFKTIELRDDRPALLKVAINSSLFHGCWVSMTPA